MGATSLTLQEVVSTGYNYYARPSMWRSPAVCKTTVHGLMAYSPYGFRYVAVGESGGTPGPVGELQSVGPGTRTMRATVFSDIGG